MRAADVTADKINVIACPVASDVSSGKKVAISPLQLIMIFGTTIGMTSRKPDMERRVATEARRPLGPTMANEPSRMTSPASAEPAKAHHRRLKRKTRMRKTAYWGLR